MSTKSYYAEITCKVVGVEVGDFEAEVLQIASALFSLENHEAARVVGDPRAVTITFGVMIAASNKRTALRDAKRIVRTALQVADGGSTVLEDEEWPEEFPKVRSIVRTELELVAA